MAGEPRAAGSAATYELIARYDVARLDAILAEEVPRAVESKVAFTPARNAVRLYRVTYPSVVPEQGNRPTVASGLVAIPEIDGPMLPVVSYQHGTVFGKEDVPSVPENSFETRLMIAQFAGQGYAVVGADYFGLGTSTEKDGYIVMGSQVQACVDMHRAARCHPSDHLRPGRARVEGVVRRAAGAVSGPVRGAVRGPATRG